MQTQWNAGYVVDTAYTLGYFNQLSLLRARWSLLLAGRAGLENPETCCELGFGNGISVNVHAAGMPQVAHWGTDFNPAQAAFAQSFAKASGSGARLFDQSFAEFGARADVPDFDFIGLHGVWGWVTPEIRASLLDFVRRKLKPGGVVYLSYNALPGWAPTMPLRELLVRHAASTSRADQNSVERMKNAVDFASKLFALNPAYARANPVAQMLMESLKQRDPSYLVHEYLNAGWVPMYFAEVAAHLAEAKLVFAAPAEYSDHLSPLHLTPAATAFLADVNDVVLRETARDFFMNTQFRADYWCKGGDFLPPAERDARIREFRFVLRIPRAMAELKIRGVLGEVALLEPAHAPILDALAESASPLRVAELEAKMAALQPSFGLKQVVQALTALAAVGHVAPAQSKDEHVAAAAQPCSRFNATVMEQTRQGGQVEWLASPVTASGIPVGRVHQLLLMAPKAGHTSPEGAAEFALSTLRSVGQTISRKGQPLTDPAQALQELVAEAKSFNDQQLPVLRALGVA